MEYLYHYHILYSVGGDLAGEHVESDTLICYDVEAVGVKGIGACILGKDAKAWTFSIRGREGRFRTNYDWALVRNTEENHKRMQSIEEAQYDRAELQKQITKLWTEVDTAAKDLR